MAFHAPRRGRRALVLTALTAASLVGVSTGTALASYSAKVTNGTLQITGSNASDTLVLTTSPTQIVGDVGGDGTTDFSFDLSSFNALNVSAGGGDDTVRFVSGGGTLSGDTVTIDGGAGDDTLQGGDANETINGGAGNDTIDGNRGADTELGGTGNDIFIWDPGDGSDVLEGQAGKDVLAFNGSNAAEHTSLTANGSRVLLTRDVAAITQDMNGVEDVELNMLGSADTVTVGDTTGTDLQTADVNLAANDGGGDGAVDTVIADGTSGDDTVTPTAQGGNVTISGLAAKVNVTGGEPANDHVDVDPLGGNDTVNAAPGDAGPSIDVDGGADSDTVNFNGTNADDTIGLADNNGTVATFTPNGEVVDSSNVENLVVHGRNGNDTIVGQNGIANLTHVTIDGDGGDDTLAGGDGDDTIDGGAGNDTIDGNRGTDTEFGGGGDDTFVWDPGDGSDVLEGQGGHNTLVFNGSNAAEKIDLSANGSRVRLFRDVAAITQDMNGIQSAVVNTLGSADTVTVNDLAGTDLKDVGVNLEANDGTGDGAADTVVVNGTPGDDAITPTAQGGNVTVSGLAAKVNVTGGEPANDHVDVDTLGGDDTVTTGPGDLGPSIDVDGGADSDTVTFNGTNADDTIGLANNNGAVATFTPNGEVVDSANVENLIVRGRKGNDTAVGQNGIAALTHLTILGGSGDDTLAGGDGDDTILGGAGNDTIDGNRGADTEFGGGGDDTFVWDPGDGSDVLEGQGGQDTLVFNGSNAAEKIDLSANGSRVRLFRDVAAITQDIDGIESAVVNTLGSADTVTVNDLAGTDLKNVGVNLAAFGGVGDGAADDVIVNGTQNPDKVHVSSDGTTVTAAGLAATTTVTGSEQANDTLNVNTLGGDDTVTVDPNVSSLIAPIVDLGADQ
jgi:Ca2+-binding RTX toxin-like protein